jgi:tetratricopeptide (TPR) repeat protein
MHRSTLALAALLALASCKKTSPPAVVAPPAALPQASLPRLAAPASDAGAERRTPAPAAPVLGLAHAHAGPVNHLARARTLRDEGDTAEALAEARRQLADVPEDEDALEAVARGARELGQRELAAAAFEALAAVRDDDALPLIQAARMRLALGDTASAVKLASAALGRDEGNVEAHQVLGRAALVDGDLRRAMDWLEQARELAPSHGWVLNNLGFAYLRANENGQALETLSRAAELLPGAAVVQNNLGVALERLGRTEEAQRAYEHSAELAPRYTRALVNRARLALLRAADAGPVASPEPADEEDTPTE